MGKVRNFWKNQNTLERKLFWSILMVVFLVASCSAAFTIYEELNLAASLCSAGCAVVCLVVAVVAVRTSFYDQCYLVMCGTLSWFLLPLLFLFCGGITSGMSLYIIASVALIAFAKPGLAKKIFFGITLCLHIGLYILTWVYQDLVVTWLEFDEAYLDILVSLVLTSVTLFAVGTISMSSYAKERASKEELLKKLEDLSRRDPLTGVFNRRYLDEFIGNLVWRNRDRACLLMLDVGDLMGINRSYGRAFGDQVLVEVANLLRRKTKKTSLEGVARYGGGIFVCVLESDSEGEAFARAESIRRDISALHFERNSLVQISTCGGFVFCGDRSVSDFKQALEKADELVNISKSMGQNNIRSLVRT